MDHPNDLVELGKITGAYGLKGWVSIQPASAHPEVLLKSRRWWLSELFKVPKKSNRPDSRLVAQAHSLDSRLSFKAFDVLSVKSHADRLVAHLMGVEQRELADLLKGARVYVSRARFPRLDPEEYYWVDLVGCDVENMQGVRFGPVQRVVDHGAHPILVVGDHLIPFVAAYVPSVNIQDKRIVVDWQEDY